MWRQNAGATYEWVCRAFNPYVGNLVGWLMLVAFGGFVLIDVITIGPSVLSLLGISPNNQWAGAAAIVIIGRRSSPPPWSASTRAPGCRSPSR